MRLGLCTLLLALAPVRALGQQGPAELLERISPAARGVQDQAIAGSFRALPPAELRAFFDGLTRASLLEPRRRAALLVLREAGSARELSRCIEIAGADDLEEELDSALAGILARDGSACDQALDRARTAAIAESEALVRGLARARTQTAACTLLRLSSDRPALAPLCCSSLCAEADALARPIAPELLSALHELLAHEEHPAAQELLLLAGRLEDDESVPLLVERLASARPELAANALWSLRRLTGLGLGPDAQAWSQWLRAESLWWSERSSSALEELHGTDFGAQCRALGELGQCFWHRQQLTGELAEYVGRARPEGVRIACGLLVRLHCASAAPALEARLDDPDPEVRACVRQALDALARKSLPPRAVKLGAPARGRQAEPGR